MAAVPDVRKRCIIWLGRPGPHEREVLAAAGWELRVVDDASGARIGLRGGDQVAALVDLRGAEPAWLAMMRDLLSRHPDLPLVALQGATSDDELPDNCLLALREPLGLEQILQLQQIVEGDPVRPSCAQGDCLIGDSPALTLATFSAFTSTPITAWPSSAKAAPETLPT